MAKPHKVSMSIGRTVNLGNYESFRMEISAEANVTESESPTTVLDTLEQGISADLEKRIKQQVKLLRG